MQNQEVKKVAWGSGMTPMMKDQETATIFPKHGILSWLDIGDERNLFQFIFRPRDVDCQHYPRPALSKV
jgi:hypothetical protein